MIIYLTTTILLILLLLIYFKLADRYNIIDKPNERSSHKSVTIRGGGVVFAFSAILWFLFYGFQYPWFIAGLILISLISFLDDVYTLSTKPRLLIHLISVVLMLYELGVFTFPWFWWIIAFVLIIGWINAFNFMDGINGITVFYALVTLLSFYLVNIRTSFIDSNFLIVVFIGAAVFGFFNARKKAKTFAGDVGSVSMAFILAFLMIKLMLYTGRWEFIVLFSVYGVDAIITIVQRLIRRENIFKAHRTHLYQYLANERKIAHTKVSLLYALVQLSINLFLIAVIDRHLLPPGLTALGILILLGLFYIWSKQRVIRTVK